MGPYKALNFHRTIFKVQDVYLNAKVVMLTIVTIKVNK